MLTVELLLVFLQETLLKDPEFSARYGMALNRIIADHKEPDEPESNEASEPNAIPDSPESPPEIPDSPESPPECPPVRLSWRDSPWAPKPRQKAQASSQSTSRAKPHDRSRSPISLAKDAQHSDMSEDEATAEPAESDGYETVEYSSASEDHYTVVTGGKRKKDKTSSRATKAKKTPVASSTPPPAKMTLGLTQPANATASPGTSRPSSPMAVPPKKAPRPPPIYLQDKSKWSEVSQLCTDNKISFSNATSCQQGIKIQVATPNDYRSMTRFLKDRKFPFHTYSLPEEIPTRVVIRRIPKEIPTEEIRKDLLAQQVPVRAVHRLHKARGGQQYDMVLVVCDHTDGFNPIFNISSVCSLKGISIEKPYRPHLVGQCHRCQLYGHSQSNCFATPRCVKCLGDHGTKDCPRPKDKSQCTEPPSCVLCGQVGHPANYRGCPKAPKLSPVAAKRFDARLKRDAPPPPARLPTSEIPTSLTPQRPSPWDKLNRQRAAIPPNPKAIPALMDLSIPAPTTAQLGKVATTTAAAASPPHTSLISQKPRRSVADIVISAYAIWMTDEVRTLADEIEAAGTLTPVSSRDLFDRYPNVTEELDNLIYVNGKWVRK